MGLVRYLTGAALTAAVLFGVLYAVAWTLAAVTGHA